MPLDVIASEGLGIPVKMLPTDRRDLACCLVAEACRLGVFQIYCETQQPVHPLALRDWVKRKLQGVLPELFDPESDSFREMLEQGPEFVGDVIDVGQGRFCPAPPRAVGIGPNEFALVAGWPATRLGQFAGHVHYSGYGRLLSLEGELPEKLGAPVISMPQFLGLTGYRSTADGLLQEYLHRPRQQWLGTPTWTAYAGDAGKSDFQFESRHQRALYGAASGQMLRIYREPLGEGQSFQHWLRIGDKGVPLDHLDWKLACLALDKLANKPRTAFMRPDGARVVTEFNFTGFAALYRLFRVIGAVPLKRNGGYSSWSIRSVDREVVSNVFERFGVKVVGGKVA